MWFLDTLRYALWFYTPEQKAELERGIAELNTSRPERIQKATQEWIARAQSHYFSEMKRLEQLDATLGEQVRLIADEEIAKMRERLWVKGNTGDKDNKVFADRMEASIRKKLKDLDK